MKQRVVITDHGFADVERERAVIEAAGAELVVAQCRTVEEVQAAAVGAAALLVQWAPITCELLGELRYCRVIVRYGIGVDNVDLEAASRAGIPVCNVPDYCIDEVADHTVTLALGLGRQLGAIDARVRSGVWKITPNRPMGAFREMSFVTLGFGRVARAVLERVRGFGFRLGAYDPFVPDEAFEAAGVTKMGLDEAIREADILALHLPLTTETRHVLNRERLAAMKYGAIVVNTARGALVDTVALAEALVSGHVGGAGLDVFEAEPLEEGHPLRRSPNTILTSHVAWYSEASVPRLQVMAAEEVVRGLKGERLRNRVNG